MKGGKKGEVGLVPGEASCAQSFELAHLVWFPLKDCDQVYRNLILFRHRSLFWEE